MDVIPASQLALMRKRLQLQKYLDEGNWAAIVDIERELNGLILEATEDPQRSPKNLLAELRKVTALYRELTQLCHFYSREQYLPRV